MNIAYKEYAIFIFDILDGALRAQTAICGSRLFIMRRGAPAKLQDKVKIYAEEECSAALFYKFFTD